MIEASNGMFYGVTSLGGMHEAGLLFQYDPLTHKYSVQFSFSDTNGILPMGSLLQANDGMLYGMTSACGKYGGGVLFRYNPLTASYIKKFDFDSINGSFPSSAIMQADDGMLYGTTSSNGIEQGGTIYKYNPTLGTLNTEYSFDSTGNNPHASLIQATDGMLYGITSWSGIVEGGILFQYNPATGIFAKKIEFNSLNGAYPFGALLQAKNGMLYGMTEKGGLYDKGII